MLCTCLIKTKCLQQPIKLLTSSNIILRSNRKVKLNKKVTLKNCITFFLLLVFSLLAEIGRHSSTRTERRLCFSFNLEVKFLLGLRPKIVALLRQNSKTESLAEIIDQFLLLAHTRKPLFVDVRCFHAITRM